MSAQEIDFGLPPNWEVRALFAPRFWTQGRLSLEMVFHPPDVLFVPAHVVPVIHPVRTIVTVHGLEYEIFKGAYSFWERLYMRFSIRFSVHASSGVIAVSKNTSRDLVRLYGVPWEKISVIYEGVSENVKAQAANAASNSNDTISKNDKPYLLFIGRLEERKNIVRIIEAFERLKENYKIPHELVLVGKPGFGYERIEYKIQNTKYKIREMGYVSEEEKSDLLRSADLFLFPTLYEGFGLPVLEAQAAGVPVVASKTSSLPEVGGDGTLYADPLSSDDIAEKTWEILSDEARRSAIIEKGLENVKRFGWDSCADGVATLLQK
jgi:glycosyltransferase involved in cell wall biosynthesis